MDKLSFKSYVWKCILGGEIAYLACLLAGFLPLGSVEVQNLHHALFEMFPGFTWINSGSVILGAVYILVFSWIFGAYYVWMHNSSMVRK